MKNGKMTIRKKLRTMEKTAKTAILTMFKESVKYNMRNNTERKRVYETTKQNSTVYNLYNNIGNSNHNNTRIQFSDRG